LAVIVEVAESSRNSLFVMPRASARSGAESTRKQA